MKVTIIIPNYNGCHFMEPCLASLKKQTYKDYQILVVDNASTDGSVEYVKEHYPEIEVIALKKNYGFSKAVNVGIRRSTTPYVILLNNDTTADPYYIEEMVRTIEKSPRIFSVSSKMIQMYHPELIDSAGDLYTLTGWGVCRGVGRPVSNYTETDEVFSACAGAAIYRRQVFQKIGSFFDQMVKLIQHNHGLCGNAFPKNGKTGLIRQRIRIFLVLFCNFPDKILLLGRNGNFSCAVVKMRFCLQEMLNIRFLSAAGTSVKDDQLALRLLVFLV